MLKRKNREGASIPTSSMADIAFLLLIFFLVATVIDVDTGIGITLPELTDSTFPPSSDRMAIILINENNEVLLDAERIAIPQIKDALKPRIRSKIDQPKRKKLIVSLKTDRKTIYSVYISALDQIKMSFFEVRDEYSNSRFGSKYKDLNDEEQKIAKDAVPIIISLAEPEIVK